MHFVSDTYLTFLFLVELARYMGFFKDGEGVNLCSDPYSHHDFTYALRHITTDQSHLLHATIPFSLYNSL
jgi:hypothetical protein